MCRWNNTTWVVFSHAKFLPSLCQVAKFEHGSHVFWSWGWGNESKRPVLVVAGRTSTISYCSKKLILLGMGHGVSVISRSTWLNWYQSCKHMSQAKMKPRTKKKLAAKSRFGCQNFLVSVWFLQILQVAPAKSTFGCQNFFGNQKWFWQASAKSKMQ